MSKIGNSLMFLAAGLLLGIVSSVGFASAAKERVKIRSYSAKNAFLADKKRAREYYNALSSVYDVLNPHLYTSSMRKEIVDLLDGDERLRILDVGCGTGYTTRGVLQLRNACEVVGVDQNRRQLGRAAESLRVEKFRSSLCRADVENLPFRDGAFDGVVSVGAVEYFPSPERALKEMTRVVRYRGTVVVGGPESDWFKKFSLNRVFYVPAVKDLKCMFRRAGLERIKTLLTGVNTFFGTDGYVVVAAGTKPNGML
jgi:MPBQ/MSBQ methyltransferase